ncbi:MAG: hypothetical protein ACRD11_14555, partial [Terriglobia bacterium]
EVSSVETASHMVVDARVENEGNGWAGSGANPWHLDKNTESILFLTNESDKPCPIGFEVTANGVHYYLTNLKLNPHETRAIDIRALRDAQKPDFKGNKIPSGATDGSVNWIRLDDVPVMGRLMVISRHGGLASSYDCNPSNCPADTVSLELLPNPVDLVPGGGSQLTIECEMKSCNGSPYYESWPASSCTWTSGNTSVASVDSSGWATGVNYGTDSIGAFGPGTTCNCAYHCSETHPAVSGTTPVNVTNVQVTSVNLASDQVSASLNASSGTVSTLTVTWNGPSGNNDIASASEGPGTYTFNPALKGLVAGQYSGVTATWDGATATYTDKFYVLGSYSQSQYNTPSESTCTGGSGTAYLTTGPPSCPWSVVSLITGFISQAWENGSGATEHYGLIQEYLAACSPPSGASDNDFREVSSIQPACGSYVSGTTVAWPSSMNTHLACADQILIVGLGSGTGTVKEVTDKCPVCAATQLDNYTTSSACSGIAGLGTFPTIRINR